MENLFRKEIMWAIGIVGMTITVFRFVATPLNEVNTDIALIQQSIETIKTNHLSHTQDLAQDIDRLAAIQVEQQKQIIEMQKQMLIIINKR